MASRENAQPNLGIGEEPAFTRLPDAYHLPEDISCTDAAHAEQGEFYRSLLENTGDIVTLTDADGCIRYVSPALTEVLGHAAEEFVGQHITVGIHADDYEHFAAHFAECVRSDGWVNIECFRLPHVDGSWRWIEARVKNLLGEKRLGGISAFRAM